MLKNTLLDKNLFPLLLGTPLLLDSNRCIGNDGKRHSNLVQGRNWSKSAVKAESSLTFLLNTSNKTIHQQPLQAMGSIIFHWNPWLSSPIFGAWYTAVRRKVTELRWNDVAKMFDCCISRTGQSKVGYSNVLSQLFSVIFPGKMACLFLFIFFLFSVVGDYVPLASSLSNPLPISIALI